MARRTLRIPDSLHDLLVSRAKEEGVSMNPILVTALSQVAALDSVRRKREAFDAMRSRVPDKKADAALQALHRTR